MDLNAYSNAIATFNRFCIQAVDMKRHSDALERAYSDLKEILIAKKAIIQREKDRFRTLGESFNDAEIDQSTNPEWVSNYGLNVASLAEEVQKEALVLVDELQTKCSRLVSYDFETQTEETERLVARISEIRDAISGESLSIAQLEQYKNELKEAGRNAFDIKRNVLLDVMDRPRNEGWFLLLKQYDQKLIDDGRELRDSVTQCKGLRSVEDIASRVRQWILDSASVVIVGAKAEVLEILSTPKKEGWGKVRSSKAGGSGNLLEDYGQEFVTKAENLREVVDSISQPAEMPAILKDAQGWIQDARESVYVRAVAAMQKIIASPKTEGWDELLSSYASGRQSELIDLEKKLTQAIETKDVNALTKLDQKIKQWCGDATHEVRKEYSQSIQSVLSRNLFVGARAYDAREELEQLDAYDWKELIRGNGILKRLQSEEYVPKKAEIKATVRMLDRKIVALLYDGREYQLDASSSGSRKDWPTRISIPVGVVPKSAWQLEVASSKSEDWRRANFLRKIGYLFDVSWIKAWMVEYWNSTINGTPSTVLIRVNFNNLDVVSRHAKDVEVLFKSITR